MEPLPLVPAVADGGDWKVRIVQQLGEAPGWIETDGIGEVAAEAQPLEVGQHIKILDGLRVVHGLEDLPAWTGEARSRCRRGVGVDLLAQIHGRGTRTVAAKMPMITEFTAAATKTRS